MKTQTHVGRILWYEGIGFLVIIALSWLNELSDLPRLTGASQYVPNWRESAAETVIVVLVAIPVMLLTRRLVSRLYYLEGFLRICAWCKKLEHDGEWVPIEDFFDLKFQTGTSHGMCLVCMDEVKAKMSTRHAA
jgi:hypothetical protein